MGWGNYIMTLFLHFWQYWGGDVIISWHYVFTLDNIWGGDDYIVALYFHSWQYLGGGDYIVALYSHPNYIWGGGDYIVTLYFHSWQYLGRGWLYRDVIFSLPTIIGEGVIKSWHYIFTPDNIWGGGDYIVTWYFHSPRIWYWVWLYLNIFTPHIWLCRGKKIPSCFIIYIHIQPIELTLKHAILFAVET